jgi:hypothetical protein
MSVTYDQLEDVAKRYTGDKASNIMAALNLTLTQKNSGSRSHMVTSHLEQMVMLKNPETPRVFTGYELPYGQYTDSYRKAEHPLMIVDVIDKYPLLHPRWTYLYVVKDLTTGIYDVIEVNHVEKLSEMHGYERPVTVNDMWQPNSVIPVGSYIYRSENHDDYENYRYGKNAKVCYISLPEVEEDGIVVSESWAKSVQYNSVEDVTIILNLNDVMLNLYGDQNTYKCFPDIGEPVRDGMLAGRRKFDYKHVASELTKNALKHVRMNDTIFKGDGNVVDIELFINVAAEDEEAIFASPHRRQIYNYYLMLKMYHENIKRVLGKIIHEKKASNQYSYLLKNMYQRSRDYLDKDQKYSAASGVFEFAYLKITTSSTKCLAEGSKITDRHGGKGVISYVFPDELMPIDEYGVRADVVLSPPGVVSRANIGQSYEHEINFISNHVVRLMKATNSMDKKYRLFQKYLNGVQPRQGVMFKSYWESLPLPKQAAVISEIEEKGIFIHQAPFGDNLKYEALKALYAEWGAKPTRLRIRRQFRDNATARFALRQSLNAPKVIHTVEPVVDYSITPFEEDGFEEEDGYVFQKGYWVPDFLNENKGEPVFEVNADVSLIPKEQAADKTSAYIDSTGSLVREYVSQREVIIAEKYIIVLKHVPDGKFSARALGTTNPLGLPNKTSKTELGGSHSTTPIRCGEMELHNMMIRVNPELVHRHIATTATNPTLRMKLAEMLITEDPLKAHDLPVISEHIENDIPAKQLQALMFCIGLEIDQT